MRIRKQTTSIIVEQWGSRTGNIKTIQLHLFHYRVVSTMK